MIEWHKRTWYSKLAAVIFFIGILPFWIYYVGTQYQLVKNSDQVQNVEFQKTIVTPANLNNKKIPDASENRMCPKGQQWTCAPCMNPLPEGVDTCPCACIGAASVSSLTLVRDDPHSTNGPLRWKDGESYKHFSRNQSLNISLSLNRVDDKSSTDVILIDPRSCEGPANGATSCSGKGIPYTIAKAVILPGSFVWNVGKDTAGKIIPAGAYRVCLGSAERCSEVNYVLNMTYGTLGIDPAVEVNTGEIIRPDENGQCPVGTKKYEVECSTNLNPTCSYRCW